MSNDHQMRLVCLDLEGVLVPEMWVAFADATGIDALKRTTRDEPDYDTLMRYRLDILASRDFTLERFQTVVTELEPYPGAQAFLDELRSRFRVIILSDTFEILAAPLMRQLGHPTLFCHQLTTDTHGRLNNYTLRLTDHKRKAVEAFRSLNFHVTALGDSFNDLTMLQAADQAAFFRASQEARAQLPSLAEFSTYREVLDWLDAAAKQSE